MAELIQWLAFAVERAQRMFLGPRFLWSVASLAVFVALVELAGERRWRLYRTRTFLTDALYFLFFTGGFYYFLFSGPLDRLIKGLVAERAPFLLLDVLGFLPDVPKAIVFIALIDGFEYLAHRLYHRYDWLWCFHCIHHSPERLTPLSKFRVHFMDMTLFGTLKAVPMLVLGSLGVNWMPFLPLMFLQVFSHFDLDVHYGPILGRILVSPRYHRVHHSADPAQNSRNFGIIFSFWDYLFGTAAADLSKPKAYGNREVQVPDDFFRQLFFPFLLLARRAGRAPRPSRALSPAQP
jgi:sterol desaturase/sphingolipid hydroxylase (fatty acid hydroxylase superfamily)